MDQTYQGQTYIDTAHLLRRAGFGADPEAVRLAAAAGLAATTDSLLHPERTPDTLEDEAFLQRLSALLPETKNGGLPTQAIKMWWAHRMVASPRPLEEKMTLFWHGHFTSKDGAMQGDLLLRQNRLFRTHALGNFRTLTLAVSRDPEMLRYLNGSQNYKAHPNENYARELMELFTCGIGHYTEDDVKAGARAFSGWNGRGGEFRFNAAQHDNDPKTFLGKTGNWNGDDIVDMLAAHPATARRLCTKLFTYFVYPNPEPAAIDALTKTYYASGYDLRAVLGHLLHSQAFYSEKARFAVIKSPAQYVAGTVRMLGLAQSAEPPLAEITPAGDRAAAGSRAMGGNGAAAGGRAKGRRLGVLASLPTAMRAMGQDLLAPPTVKGWDGGEAWINTSTLLARIAFADTVSRSRFLLGGQTPRLTDYIQQNGLTPAAFVDALAARLGPLPLSAATRQTLLEYVNGSGPLEDRLRGVLPLLMATPEYQVC